jgi:glycosidase
MQASDALYEGTRVRVLAADLAAMVLVHEVLHEVVTLYKAEHDTALSRALGVNDDRSDAEREAFQVVSRAFVTGFPSPSILNNQEEPEQFLSRKENAERVATETLLLYVANENPAYAAAKPFISDDELRKRTPYLGWLTRAGHELEGAPRMGPSNESLLEMLLAPQKASPASLLGQIDFMRTRWSTVLKSGALMRKLLFARDLLMESSWSFRGGHHNGPGGELPPDTSARSFFHGQDEEYERFTEDRDWMPNVVMIAKSTFVWLAQLEKAYGRPVRTLADIPDEELATFSRRGINALWLIGLWKRSHASARIKRMMGNEQALASAYSLAEYDIADELGGYGAFMELKRRAQLHGVRLASDMVPNHVGVDAGWVVRHPEFFLQAKEPPYPNYTFNGPDLSDDSRVGVFIEDGYWRRTDAAVVFKRVDYATNDVRYIYHGNDGTSMPWNDTAQLDYTKKEVREAVINTILHVARMFPIIRFDAAMTLAKRHYQRLWFPEPGTGGDIPSRAAYAMTREELSRVMPEEFWREVVDRAAAEAPDTLLLAEAFWMMEGYFVRTLGMHRVYNSAFMHMLKSEDNQNFRTTIKNVLEFDPEVLKRFVNFMNNPDEKTAIEQFGDGDKYFGCCLLMCTLPGLPMVGHGQIEGYREKYGMEYARPRMDESENPWLVARHEREIFPLLKLRHTFSGSRDFRMFDFVTDDGGVNEDVIAFSNRDPQSGRAALVLFNNRYAETTGSVRLSSAFKHVQNKDGGLVREDLVKSLGLDWADDTSFVVFRDHERQLEFLRTVGDLGKRGLRMELSAFSHVCFSEIVVANAKKRLPLDRVRAEIGDRAVRDVFGYAEEIFLRSLHAPFADLLEATLIACTPDPLESIVPPGYEPSSPLPPPKAPPPSLQALSLALTDALERNVEGLAEEDVRLALRVDFLHKGPSDDLSTLLAAFAATDAAVHLANVSAEDLRLELPLRRALSPALGLSEQAVAELVVTLTVLTLTGTLTELLLEATQDPRVRSFLLVHDAAAVTWFNKERWVAFTTALAHAMRLDTLEVPDLELAGALEAGEKSAYRLEDLLVDLREKERSAHVARVARESERILEQSTTAEVLRIVETDGKDGDRR